MRRRTVSLAGHGHGPKASTNAMGPGIWMVVVGIGLGAPAVGWSHQGEIEEDVSTTELLQVAGAQSRASGAAGQAGLAHLMELAARRKALLLRKLEHDPLMVLRHSLPSSVRERLPAAVQGLVEEPMELEGELTLLRADDFANDRSELLYELREHRSPHRLFQLHFAADPPSGLLSGSRVRARGVRLDSHLVLEQGGSSSLQTVSAAPSLVSGDQRVLVFLVNFTNTTAQPWSASQVQSVMFTATNSTNRYFQDTSFGQVSFSGDVVGWYTVPYDSSLSCSYNNWASAAESAATNAGVPVSQYPRRVFLFPKASSCSWGGLGTLGGNPSRAWSNGYNDSRLLSHEVGHNLGVHHASTLQCGTKAVDLYANCSVSEYGDVYDTMGSWNLFQFNAPHKIAMGWVPASRVVEVTSNGLHSVSLLEVGGTSAQALRIRKPDTNEYYYVSYRQLLGFDASLPAGITRGGSLHIWNASVGSQTKLLDTTPGDGFSNAALADGASFVDSLNGMTITQVSHDASSATFSVEFGNGICASAAPAVSVSPLNQSGSAGQVRSYTVSVTNQDAPVCAPTIFSLTSVVPVGWGASFSPGSLSLNSGASGSSTWSVSSAMSALDGSYDLSATIVDGTNVSHQNSVSSTYVVFTDAAPPAVQITKPADGSTVSRTMTIEVSASDNVKVTKVEIAVDGVLKDTDTVAPYTYGWNTRRASRGLHVVSATAYDEAGNKASASVTVYK